MRKFIDIVRVADEDLAYTIVEALEKKGEYSVDFFEHCGGEPMTRRGGHEIELKVYRNEKIIHTSPIGLAKGEQKV